MGVFSTGGIGLDLGSANVTICLENEGVVLREPSYVLHARTEPDDVLAVGRDARQMLGRTPRDVVLASPVQYGAVADTRMATTLVQSLVEKALGKRRALEKNRLVVSCSQGLTRVELQALEKAVQAAGARKAALLRAPVAAALGAGLNIGQPKGTMVIVLGGSTVEVSILSMNSIAAARSMRTGGLAADQAIIRRIRREKSLIIGQRTAEDLKTDLGSLRDASTIGQEAVTLRGRDARTSRPTTVEISPLDIHKALMPVAQDLLEGIREAFENTPAEMAEDILERGITLSGGGALMDGLAERLTDMLNLPVNVGENPQDDVAVGCCMAASDDRLASALQQSGCLIEL